MAKIAWMKFEPMELLIIYWQDITSQDAWASPEEIQSAELLQCVTAGYLIGQDKDLIRIASTICNNDMASFILIPKSVVQKVKRVEYDRD